MSHISLCLLMMKPPHLQDIACSTENALPQIHVVDIPSGFHPYHNDIASQKALLCRQYPNSSMGSTVSNVEALFLFGQIYCKLDMSLGDSLLRVSARTCSSFFFLFNFLIVAIWESLTSFV